MFWKSTYNECIKIVAKPRSYIGMAAITALVGVILFAMLVDGHKYVSMITSSFEQTFAFKGNLLNGYFMAYIVLQMLIIHVPLLIALVTGDLVSGEASAGTLRMLVSKPISRSEILLSKFLAGNIYTLIILIWLGILALGVGNLLFGPGDLIIFKAEGLVILPGDDVLWRFFSGFIVAYLALVTVSTLSITLSCFTDNSIGPIVTTMAIIILFTIIGNLDVQVFDSVRPFLFTTHMVAWRSFFDDPIREYEIVKAVLVLLTHIIVLLGIALYKFNKKDILS